jgi:hypothetical protein
MKQHMKRSFIMKKIISIFLIIAVLSCVLASCNDLAFDIGEGTFDSTHTSGTAKSIPNWFSYYDAKALSKTFYSWDELVECVKNNDPAEFFWGGTYDPESEEETLMYERYEKLLKEYHDDGYIIYATHDTAEMRQDHFVMYGTVRTQDNGIQQRFFYNGATINVRIYHVNDEVEYPLGEFEDNNYAYLLYRYGTGSFADKVEKIDAIVEGNIQPVYAKFAEDDPNDAFENSLVMFFIDDDHYVSFSVSNPPPKEELIEFVEGLSFDIIWLE